MTDRPRKSLAQYAADAAEPDAGGVVCPRCGCKDFRAYKTIRQNSQTVRYKKCRHCDWRILTKQPHAEESILRSVVDDEPRQLLKIA